MVRKYYRTIQKVLFMYIVTGILKVFENAKISQMQLKKVELGSQNVKKVKLFFLSKTCFSPVF